MSRFLKPAVANRPNALGLVSHCTCAPVFDYTGREVARVGLFAHQSEDAALETEFQHACRELARQISVRLGHLPAAFMSVTA